MKKVFDKIFAPSDIRKIILTLLPIFVFYFTQGQTMRHKVVFQLTSNDTLVQKALITQLKNITTEMDSLQIEVVCHSNGINFLIKDKTKFTGEIQALNQNGIAFAACQNSMKERNITPSEIIPIAIFVPSGIIEIIKKQEAGGVISKPGFEDE